MKKSYINPAAKTADVKIRATLLAGSEPGKVNNTPVSGQPGSPIQGGARERSNVSSNASLD